VLALGEFHAVTGRLRPPWGRKRTEVVRDRTGELFGEIRVGGDAAIDAATLLGSRRSSLLDLGRHAQF